MGAIVAAVTPSRGTFDRVEQVGASGSPGSPPSRGPIPSRLAPGSPSFETTAGPAFWSMPEAADRADRARDLGPGMEGAARRQTRRNPGENRLFFLNIEIPSGQHELILKYDPAEVRLGLAVSFCSLVLLILVLTGIRLFWIPGITTRRGLDGAEPSG